MAEQLPAQEPDVPQEDYDGVYDESLEYFLVRAKFDFVAGDGTALSFNAGDIIQVFSRLESGWWDGMLNGQRGWFPSNYVEEVTEEELQDMETAPIQSNSGDVLDVDDVLWGGDWGGGAGLDRIAREMMEDNEDESDEGFGFVVEARRRQAQLANPMRGTEFGISERVAGEQSEISEGTVRPATITSRTAPPDITIQERDPENHENDAGEDAWIPSITPDGQVYYHNTLTGEDSWDLPTNSSTFDDPSDPYAQSDEHFLADISSPLREDFSQPTSANDAGFAVPPRAYEEIPYPWVAKMSDDGREWFYHNRITGQTQKDPPIGGDAESIADMTRNLSLSNVPARPRQSLLTERKTLEDWTAKTTSALLSLASPSNPPTMEALLDVVQDLLRKILESTVAGSAAEEELSRATDLNSPAGISAALNREEGAVESLAYSYRITLSAIRDLLTSFGYVGPLESFTDMPRPAWTSDLTLVGSIGVLSSSVHSAMVLKRQPEGNLSLWSEVLRSAGKLRDIVNNLPSLIFQGEERDRQNREGKRQGGYLSFSESLGDMLGGKWGFGKVISGYPALEQEVVVECQRIKGEYEDTIQNLYRSLQNPNSEDDTTDAVIELLRTCEKFRKSVEMIDIASKIDVDGDLGDWPSGYQPRKDDLEEYMHLAEQARLALSDLDASLGEITEIPCAILDALSWDPENLAEQVEKLSIALSNAFRALPTLLIISREQGAANEQGLIRGQLGWRSPKHKMATNKNGHERSESLASTGSRRSRLSDVIRRKIRGLEEEDPTGRDQLGDLPSAGDSANASQSSFQHHRSASSSSTSLAYQPTESDGMSQKGNRSSILRAFRRNRSGSDAFDGPKSRGIGGTNKKLAKLLGEDVPVVSIPPPLTHNQSHGHHLAGPPPLQPYQPMQLQPLSQMQRQMQMPVQQETPWYMMDDYVSGEIIFDDKGAVKAGTLRALVIRLTSHSITDTPFFQAFLLTFRSFTNPPELFEHLQDRYFLPRPQNLSPEQFDEWKSKKKWYIQLRVVNAMRQWLEKHFLRSTDEAVLDRVEELAGRMREEDGKAELMCKQLLQLVAKRRQSDPEQIMSGTSGSLLSPPAPLVPRVTGRPLRLSDVPPLEIARQLTILEFGLFQNVKPSEFLTKVYQGDDKLSPNVRKIIFTANTMAGWVALAILGSRDAKVRAATMKTWIQVAVECRNLNNFSSLAAISAGLNSAPISRLRRTKEHLSAKTVALKAELDKAMDSSRNFSNYKEMLKTINPPCVPFLGFYLTALTFIEDGNRSFLKPGAPTKGNALPPSTSANSLSNSVGPSTLNGAATGSGEQEIIPTKPLINFFKRALSAEILRDIAQYQSQPYRLARSRVVQDYMSKEFREVEKAGDLYDLSIEVEPREKEEERITRMLHDSGFI